MVIIYLFIYLFIMQLDKTVFSLRLPLMQILCSHLLHFYHVLA